MTDLPTGWDRLGLVLDCFLSDPQGLGGIWLRLRHGPVREAVQNLLADLPRKICPIHPNLEDRALFGGPDLAAMLADGQTRTTPGLAAKSSMFVLNRAECATPRFAARLTQMMDQRTHSIIALDEGCDGDDTPPTALTERMAFFVDLNPVSLRDLHPLLISPDCKPAEIDDQQVQALVQTAAELGVSSLRPVTFAVRAARILAGRDGRRQVTDADLRAAAALVLGHRSLPEDAPDIQDSSPPDQNDTNPDNDPAEAQTPDPRDLEDQLVAAAQTALPPDLLAQLAAGHRQRKTGASQGSGDRLRHNRRGRPKPSRPGRLSAGKQIDIPATLRAAAPWQKLRQRPAHTHLALRSSDLRIKSFENRSDRLLIFAVDASGSSAMARLNEAKGAVEILLAQAYARRDHVALVAFRKDRADLLLPPTRSLLQARKRLSALPGGGGTPLASGLHRALIEAQQAQHHGLTPSLILLTDGRANVALDGAGDRQAAQQQSNSMATAIANARLSAIVIDTARRQSPHLQELAHHMQATYLPLQLADAAGISTAVGGILDASG
ncbi:VWA domain-containing protein [Phaeobacter sp.]|uniref:VWA domain-containing protein n=1 Tax=Phaeobacter sp. TaxID=1902409 RepID=UPI0025CF6891|nr:VWA domain-containing protein [Phaeobacter sp.]